MIITQNSLVPHPRASHLYITLLRHEGSKKALSSKCVAHSGIWGGKNCLLCTETKEQNTNQLTLPATQGNRES